MCYEFRVNTSTLGAIFSRNEWRSEWLRIAG